MKNNDSGVIFMYKTKLCLGVSLSFGVGTEEQIRIFHSAGFEGFLPSGTKILEITASLQMSLAWFISQFMHLLKTVQKCGSAAKMPKWQ